jgi:hypothetical protein
LISLKPRVHLYKLYPKKENEGALLKYFFLSLKSLRGDAITYSWAMPAPLSAAWALARAETVEMP